MLRFGVLLRYHTISLSHFTVNFVKKNIERACVILKLHELYPDDELLKHRQVKEYLFKIDEKCGDSCVYEEANSISRFQGINAYLMKDSTKGYDQGRINNNNFCPAF